MNKKPVTETIVTHSRFLIALLVTIFLFRLGSSIIHPPTVQHDRLHHHQYIRALAHGSYEKNYEGPYYYGIAAVHTIISRTIRDSFFPDSHRQNISNGIIATNAILFLALIFGLAKLFSLLTSEKEYALLMTALSLSFPVLHRSFNMARPENLMIVALVWGLYVLIRLLQEEHCRRVLTRLLLASSFLFALCVTQKITGIVACISAVFAAGWCTSTKFSYRLKVIALSITSVSLISASLWGAQYALSGSTFYRHHEQCGDSCGPNDLAVLYRVSPTAVWASPFRNTHANSMINILLTDFYGDYWRYGIDAPLYGKRRAIRVTRVRIGILVTCSYSILFLICLLYLIRQKPYRQYYRLPYGAQALLCIPLAGYCFLLIACFITPYRQSEFDLIKWEYILWILPFLTIPILGVLEDSKQNRLTPSIQYACYALIIAGLIQSTPLYHQWIMRPVRMFISNDRKAKPVSNQNFTPLPAPPTAVACLHAFS